MKNKQSSCLGPLPFLYYVNDPPYAARDSVTSMYADDTNLFLCFKNIKDLNEAINSEVGDFDCWPSGNKLPVDVAKTSGNANLH